MSVRIDVIVSAVALEAGLDPDRVAQDRINIVSFINDTRREIAELPIDFQQLQFRTEFVGVANVTAGTVAATQNQAEVTGTSTSFTTAMAGRYISVDSQPWQRVSFVSDTTHLTLESSWGPTTRTGVTYKIWKRFYELPPKIDKVLSIVDLSQPSEPLAPLNPFEFYHRFGFADSFTTPQFYTLFSSTDLALEYLGSTTYTVTTTANSPIMDFGSGSGVVTAIAPGDRIMIGATPTAFYVERVLTDTKLVLDRVSTVSSAAVTVTGASMNRMYVQLYPAFDAVQRPFYVEAKMYLRNLFNNEDTIEEGWYTAVKAGAIAKAMGYINSPKEQAKEVEYAKAVQNLIKAQQKFRNPMPRLQPLIPRRYGLMGYPFGSTRDIRR